MKKKRLVIEVLDADKRVVHEVSVGSYEEANRITPGLKAKVPPGGSLSLYEAAR